MTLTFDDPDETDTSSDNPIIQFNDTVETMEMLDSLYPESKPRLALDMDSTLAASMNAVFDHLGTDYTYDDVETWNWPIETLGAQPFLDGFDHVWSECWQDVDPLEDAVADTVAELRDVFEVHVVTAQPTDPRISRGKVRWLNQHEIPYDGFETVARDGTKADLRYDVFVDDKPALPERVAERAPSETLVYLYDQPYNREADGEYTRIESLDALLRHFVTGTTRENPEEPVIHNE